MPRNGTCGLKVRFRVFLWLLIQTQTAIKKYLQDNQQHLHHNRFSPYTADIKLHVSILYPPA